MLVDVDPYDLPNDLNVKYGVIAHTGTGDGWFNLYVSGNDKAILIGGRTQYKIVIEHRIN